MIFEMHYEYVWRLVSIYDPDVLVRALPGLALRFGMTVPRNFELAHLLAPRSYART